MKATVKEMRNSRLVADFRCSWYSEETACPKNHPNNLHVRDQGNTAKRRGKQGGSKPNKETEERQNQVQLMWP